MNHCPDITARGEVNSHGSFSKIQPFVPCLPFQTERLFELTKSNGVKAKNGFAVCINEMLQVVSLKFIFKAKIEIAGQCSSKGKTGSSDIKTIIRSFIFSK